jgi:hypothetical protein
MVSKPTNISAGPHPANKKRICYSNRYPTKNKHVFFFFPGLKGWYLCGKPINHQECTHKCWPFWCVPPSHFWDQHVHASPFLDQRTDWKDMLYNCVPTFAVVRLHLHRFYTQNSPLFSQKKYIRQINLIRGSSLVSMFFSPSREIKTSITRWLDVFVFYLRFIQRVKESLMW